MDEITQASDVSHSDVQTPAPTPVVNDSGNQGEAQPYQPNYKFKVMDKELEIPEKWRGYIKDPVTEKEAREIFEKAEGLKYVKDDRDQAKTKFNEYRSNAEPVVQKYTQAAQAYQRGLKALEGGSHKQAMAHLTHAFGTLGINPSVLKQYVYNQLQLEDLQPHERNEYNRFSEMELQNIQLQQQLAEKENHFKQFAVQQRTSELHQAMSSPDVAPIAQAYDSRKGQGAFQNEVIMRGQYYAQAMGKDASAWELVREVAEMLGHLGQPTQTPPMQQAHSQVPGQVPVIPTVNGGVAPVRRRVKTVEDIEKAYREL